MAMQEKKQGVVRLLRSIENNIDDNNIHVLAGLLNYQEQQLREDIDAIRNVSVLNKDEIEE